MTRCNVAWSLFAAPFLAFALFTPACSAPSASNQSVPRANAASSTNDDIDERVASVLDAIRARDTGQLAVSKEDGEFLRVLVATNRSRRVLEIGGASGYSGIWLALGLRDTGGHLTTIEYDPERAREADENVRKAGVADVVRVIHGDAFKEIPKLAGTFDFVFLDAWKKDYKRFLDLVLPRLDPGGLFLAHNVVNKRTEMPEFLDAITHDPNLWTAIVTPSGEGISISYKRRPFDSRDASLAQGK